MSSELPSPFPIRDRFRIPYGPGNAVDRGWTQATGFLPVAVTWHWSATSTLDECGALIGGSTPLRRGLASAHFAIGRSFEEGVDRYVSLEDRSWHAGKNQTVRCDGGAFRGDEDKASRTAVGIETVNLGYARAGLPAGPGWLRADSPNGRQRMRIQPWTEDQTEMMIMIGRTIVARWPHIGPRDHHGHHDICPDYKTDVAAFPFARVLRGIYGDPSLPDVWSPYWTVPQRRRALADVGRLPPESATGGLWDATCDRALRGFQSDHGLVVNGRWSTFVGWELHRARQHSGEDLKRDLPRS